MEVTSSSETSVLRRSTRCHIREEGILHSHRRGNLKSNQRISIAWRMLIGRCLIKQEAIFCFMLPAIWADCPSLCTALQCCLLVLTYLPPLGSHIPPSRMTCTQTPCLVTQKDDVAIRTSCVTQLQTRAQVCMSHCVCPLLLCSTANRSSVTSEPVSPRDKVRNMSARKLAVALRNFICRGGS
jgi:hypothetical protein